MESFVSFNNCLASSTLPFSSRVKASVMMFSNVILSTGIPPYLISFRNTFPVALPAARLAILFPTVPLCTAFISPSILANK